MRERDRIDRQAETDRLFATALVVFEIAVVDDLGERIERAISNATTQKQHLERATSPLVRIFTLEHVEAQLPGLRPVRFARDELDPPVGIDEAADQPRAG